MNGTTGTSSTPDAASPPQYFSTLAAAGLGIAFHVISQNFELDDHAWRLIGGFNALFVSAVVASVHFLGNGVVAATSQLVPLAACALAGLYGSIAVRRLFLSPLRKFPGPWQARLTKFYHTWLQSKNMQLFVEVEKMHERYGDFVRTGPREISIRRPSAISLIYGAKSTCRKAPWYKHTEFDEDENSLVNLINVQKHNKRRRLFDQGFNAKALTNYEPRVRNKVDTLLAKLSEHRGQPVDVTEWMSYFSFDVMGDVIYSKEYNMMHAADGKMAANGKEVTLRDLHAAMKIMGYMGATPWVIRMLSQAGLAGDFGIMREWCQGAMRDKQANWKKGEAPSDASSYLLQAFLEGEEDAAAPTRQTQQSLLQDSILLIIAGSDTTSSAAANALYYLAAHPATYARLQRALAAAFPDGTTPTSDQVRDRVPLVDHVVNETLRLKPPVCEGLLRETPAEGLVVDGVFIPGGTVVSVPTWAMQRDGRSWGADAGEWRPERWAEKEDGGVNPNGEGVAFLPFSRGVYSCVGKILAYMELRSVVAGVAMRFDLGFAEGEDGVAFERGPMDTFTMTNRPLRLVFRERG